MSYKVRKIQFSFIIKFFQIVWLTFFTHFNETHLKKNRLKRGNPKNSHTQCDHRHAHILEMSQFLNVINEMAGFSYKSIIFLLLVITRFKIYGSDPNLLYTLDSSLLNFLF